MQTKMQKWGNSYAVRLPRAVVRASGLREGEALEIEAAGRQIRLRRASRKEYRLEQLVRAIRKANRHDEFDLGTPQGGEAW